MTRRDTIIISVLINVGLLTILFATAMTGEGELTQAPESPENTVVSEQKLVEPETPLTVRQFRQEASREVVDTPAQETVAATKPEESAPRQTAREEETVLHFVVKRGDSLEKVARRHGLSIEAVVKANGLRSATLQAGQVLKIPVATAAEETTALRQPSQRPQAQYYVVKSGDNPWSIAKRNGVALEELLRLNELDDHKARQLRPGDTLRIR